MALRKELVRVKRLSPKKQSDWSDWQQPVMVPRKYTMFCCDCDLAHQFEFKIKRDVYNPGDGTTCDRVWFRVRRSNGYTQARRRHDAKAAPHKTGCGILVLDKGEKVRSLEDGTFIAVLPNYLRRKRYAKTASPIRPARKNPRQRQRKR